MYGKWLFYYLKKNLSQFYDVLILKFYQLNVLWETLKDNYDLNSFKVKNYTLQKKETHKILYFILFYLQFKYNFLDNVMWFFF